MYNEYYTIATYLAIRGINVNIDSALFYYNKAAELSHKYGYDIRTKQDEQIGTVNIYHIDILKEVLKIFYIHHIYINYDQ